MSFTDFFMESSSIKISSTFDSMRSIPITASSFTRFGVGSSLSESIIILWRFFVCGVGGVGRDNKHFASWGFPKL